MKTPRGASESSTTSDNTGEFIDIVKRFDVVYNTHNPDYKNAEVKMKIWSQIADEIGLSVDASKRKWKNLRDSYTKYLRSFRVGTKTSKKYQYWAHADHMDFLKPYQGPGRNSNNNHNHNHNNNSSSHKPLDEDDNECDLGYQVLAKATSSSEEDVKHPSSTQSQYPQSRHSSGGPAKGASRPGVGAAAPTASGCSSTGGVALPMPSLPTVTLPQLSGKPHLPTMSPSTTTMPPQVYPLPTLTSGVKPTTAVPNATTAIPMPSSSTASSVGCLILEPHLFAAANAAATAAAATSSDAFKKEFNACMPNLGFFQSSTAAACHVSTTSAAPRANPPLITKIRRVQPSQKPPAAASTTATTATAINLSFSAMATATATATTTAPAGAGATTPAQGPAAKVRKLSAKHSERLLDVDVAAVVHANRDLDANTLFFLSLARSVREMPTKLQSLAKMRCMRIVSDIELELDSVNMDCVPAHSTQDSQSPTPPDANSTEHFVYVMSPSRVESMIDISSDDEGERPNGN